MISPQDETLANELLPCPFCGAHAEFETWQLISTEIPNVGVIVEHADDCPLASATDHIPMYFSEAEAITAWNTRSSPPTQRGEIEQPLRTALRFAASRSAITSAQEQAILAALSTQRDDRNAVLALRDAGDAMYTRLRAHKREMGDWVCMDAWEDAVAALKSDSGDAPEGGRL